MKKLLGILLVIVFVFSIYFSISNDVATKSNDSISYASVLIPNPPPEPPGRKGC